MKDEKEKNFYYNVWSVYDCAASNYRISKQFFLIFFISKRDFESNFVYQGRWLRFFYLFVGNIVWFIPFGAFWYGIGTRRDMRRVLLLGSLFSLTIETLQFVFGTGVSELDDLILNTFGVWVGAKSCQICLKIFGLPQEKRS